MTYSSGARLASASEDRPINAVFRRLSPESWAALAPHITLVRLPLGQTIYQPGSRIEAVWFPVGAQLSQVNRSADGRGVETAMVGVEGAAGILETLGSGIGIWECLVQVDGDAFRVPASVIRRLAMEDASFAAECWRLAELQAMESQQSVACQALHGGEGRLARWLLEAYDRTAGRNPLPLTQEVLAIMLGVQRTTVTAFQASLAADRLIKVQRGRVSIEDHPGLERRACACRAVVRERRRDLGLDRPQA